MSSAGGKAYVWTLALSTVPAAAALTLPVEMLRARSPIVLDAAYRPRETPLLTAAAAAG